MQQFAPDFFGGDARSFAYSGSYRARFDIDFKVSDFTDISGAFKLLTNGPPFGLTTGYPSSNISQSGVAPCIYLATGPFTSSAIAQVNGSNHAIPGDTIAPSGVRISFNLHAGNPLVFASPEIDGDIVMTFTQFIDPETGEQRLDYDIHAEHDAFPAHEFYLQQQMIEVEVIPDQLFEELSSSYSIGGMLFYDPTEIPPTAQSAYSPNAADAVPAIGLGFPPLIHWKAQGQIVTSQAP